MDLLQRAEDWNSSRISWYEVLSNLVVRSRRAVPFPFDYKIGSWDCSFSIYDPWYFWEQNHTIFFVLRRASPLCFSTWSFLWRGQGKTERPINSIARVEVDIRW